MIENKNAYEIFLETCEKREERWNKFVEHMNNINYELEQEGKIDFDKFMKWRKKI